MRMPFATNVDIKSYNRMLFLREDANAANVEWLLGLDYRFRSSKFVGVISFMFTRHSGLLLFTDFRNHLSEIPALVEMVSLALMFSLTIRQTHQKMSLRSSGDA